MVSALRYYSSHEHEDFKTGLHDISSILHLEGLCLSEYSFAIVLEAADRSLQVVSLAFEEEKVVL